MTIHLRNVAAAHPRTSNLRKRVSRKLRPVRPSHKNELWYKAELLGVVRRMTAMVKDELLPVLNKIAPLYAKSSDRLVLDRGTSSSVIDDRINAMKNRIGIQATATRLADAATRRNLIESDMRLTASVKASMNIDLSGFLIRSGPIQTVLEAATRANVSLIKSIPDQYFDKISEAILQNMANGMRFDALAEEIQHIGDVTESRAKLIARDQTSKMTGAFTMIRQTSLGIASYTWSTAQDERVRDEHAALDGEEFRWDAPPSEGHPGEAIACRCVAIPLINLDDPEPDESGGGFGEAVNTASVLATIGSFFGEFAAGHS